MRVAPWFLLVALTLGCNSESIGNAPLDPKAQQQTTTQTTKPPFDVRGELEGLVLTWFDAQGVHNAHKRSDIPEHRRAQVRVDSLEVAPDQRLDPSLVYIADLRTPQADGSYAVHTMERAAFDALVDKTAGVAINLPAPTADAPNADTDPQASPTSDKPIVIYKASWCGACKAAAAYLRQRGVTFTERDVEKDPGAQAEMQQKARAAGVSPRGVPVIDFRGTLLMGFDKQRLSQLIDQGSI